MEVEGWADFGRAQAAPLVREIGVRQSHATPRHVQVTIYSQHAGVVHCCYLGAETDVIQNNKEIQIQTKRSSTGRLTSAGDIV